MKQTKAISHANVTFNGGFWKSRYDLNRQVSIKSVYERFEESGRFDALRFNYKEGQPVPHIFYDSDAAKWIEAVAYLIIGDRGGYEEEQKIIDALVDSMEKNQMENGYINSHFMQIEPENIFKKRGDHELYCAGHLLEAAIAYDMATGKSKLLNIMKKYMDCIEKAFITEKTAAFSTCGHEEIELALLKMYEYSADKKYLDMAMFFINTRGTQAEAWVWPEHFNPKYDQSEMPARQLTKADGHAVRAVYLYIAMSEAARITGDAELKKACDRVLDNIVSQRMYITGGIGSGKVGECFTSDYDLPNLEAYSESCAALGLALFAHSMQRHGLNAKYAEIIETVMYNNMLSSTSLDGKAFFYENPLEYHLASVDKEVSVEPKLRAKLPIRHRLEVFGCSCCPPNINRVFAKVGEFFLSEYGDGLVVNQYGDLTATTDKLDLTVKTAYPADGKVKLLVSKCDYGKIYLRKPAWCEKFDIDVPFEEKDSYIVVDSAHKEINIDFNMHAYYVEANPMVRADNGRVALCYGPTVYCLERLDNPYELNAVSVDILGKVSLTKNRDGEIEGAMKHECPWLTVTGYVDEKFDGLYRKAKRNKAPAKLCFRPYWTFANREECDMLVWVRAKD